MNPLSQALACSTGWPSNNLLSLVAVVSLFSMLAFTAWMDARVDRRRR